MIKQKLAKWNTMRNQILVIFVSAMIFVLLLVGFMTFNLVTDILKNNAENQIEVTANETLGRIDSQFETIEMITSQIGTNAAVQNLLFDHLNGQTVSFIQRQSMNQIINSFQAYTSGISSFELYFTNYSRLFPLNELPLPERIEPHWIERSENENGRIVWAGEDPLDNDSFLAIKKINIFDKNFSHGGYLLTKVNRGYFDFKSEHGQLDMDTDYAVLLDQEQTIISTNMPPELRTELEVNTNGQVVTMNGNDFVRVQSFSDYTGWSLIMFTPVNSLLQGISGIGTAILVSGSVGFIIFIVASYFMSTFLTKPIQRLTHAMRFGRLGALKESPEMASATEITELNNTYNNMVETTNHLIKVVYEEELTRSRAELKALQAQINPHFLFNTLEALYWMIEENDEESANLIIITSQLFRYTISDIKDDDWVALQTEIDHIERYLHIMKLRFGSRLTWAIKMDNTAGSALLPKLLIQPIVENAIVHGIANTLHNGTVTITVIPSKTAGYLQIVVKDNGAGMDNDTKNRVIRSMKTRTSVNSKGTGLALANVQQRIDLSYTSFKHARLCIESQRGNGTTVVFTIPEQGGNIHESKTNSDR